MSSAVRTLVVWCPDWPVVAAGFSADEPVAVVHANRVMACSAAARAEGVRRGLRRREAQGRCPVLTVVEHDPSGAARAFEPVVAAVEEFAPGVEIGAKVADARRAVAAMTYVPHLGFVGLPGGTGADLPAGGYATPCTYMVKGRQYVVIAAGGGGKLGTKSGDSYMAFALPANSNTQRRSVRRERRGKWIIQSPSD